MEHADVATEVAVDRYLGWMTIEKGRRPNTTAAYARDLAIAASWFAARGVALVEVDLGDLEAYVAHQVAAGRAPASVARSASVLSNFFRFCVDEGLRRSDPSADLDPRRSASVLPKALSVEEVARILDGIVGDEPLDRRDRALLELLYATGARVSEATGLNVGDLDRTDGLLVLRGKGDRERVVPVGSVAQQAVERWLSAGGRGALMPKRWAHRGDEAALFLTARGGRLTRQAAFALLRRRARAVGLGEFVSPHVLRHSCATHLLHNGADIRVVQELLGHRSIATTQRYTKVDTRHLRAAVVAAHPRGRGATPSA